MRAGSVPWLVRHELRLAWRAARLGGSRMLVVVLLIGLATLFTGVPLGYGLSRVDVAPTPELLVSLDAGLLIVFSLLASRTLGTATLALYERGDLDLLLSSPIHARRVLAARAVVIALNPFLVVALLITPALLPAVAFGHPAWLAGYAVLAGLAIVAASAGIALATGLFTLIGPRRTRLVGQLVAATIGAGAFLVSQARATFPEARDALGETMRGWAAAGGFGLGAPITWPARAALGQPAALAAWLALSVAVFAGTVAALGGRFAAIAAISAGLPTTSRGAAAAALRPGRFRTAPFAAIMRKEIWLVLRDPTLASQVLLRALYLVPILVVLLRNAAQHHRVATASAAGGICFLAGQLAGSLAWITISAEDAPDLIAGAPIGPATARRAKLAAALLAVAALLAGPVAAMLVLSVPAAIVTAGGAALSATCAGLLNLWLEKPARRSAFRTRRDGSIAVSVFETLSGLFWTVATVVALLMVL